MVIPAQTTNPRCVAGHAAQALLIFDIPQLTGKARHVLKKKKQKACSVHTLSAYELR